MKKNIKKDYVNNPFTNVFNQTRYKKPQKLSLRLAKLGLAIALILFLIFGMVSIAKAYFRRQMIKDCYGWQLDEKQFAGFELAEREIKMCENLNIKIK